VVVKDEFVRETVQPEELVAQICKKRLTFVPDEVWDKLGLPRGEEQSDEVGNTATK
jgi:hypothetical protein